MKRQRIIPKVQVRTVTFLFKSLNHSNALLIYIYGFSLVETTPLRPYGLPAIRELLRVLVSLLNPHEHKHTDSMRLMALSILNVAFEVGGKSISRFETLRTLVADEFCKYLFQVQTIEHLFFYNVPRTKTLYLFVVFFSIFSFFCFVLI